MGQMIDLYLTKCVDYKTLGLARSICLVVSNNAVKTVRGPMITCFIIAQNARKGIQNVYSQLANYVMSVTQVYSIVWR